MANHSDSLSLDISGLGPTEVAITRSRKRRSLALRVHETRVEVLAPTRVRDRHIIALLEAKARWIRKKVVEQRDIPPYRLKNFVSGERFLYLGEGYELKVCPGPKKEVRLAGHHILMSLKVSSAASKRAALRGRQLERWFRREAEDVLRDRCRKFAGLMGVEVKSVLVRTYKSQWGNCSVQGHIKFNWRLIMAPLQVIDYVVVHELAHLTHHNHSPAFWAEVAHHMPEYKSHRAWLKKYGSSLRMD